MLRKCFVYDIQDVVPYINWLYFYHAWGLSGKPIAEKEKLKNEACKMLDTWQGKYHTHALFGLFDAVSEGDDILLETRSAQTVRLPMLRQQHSIGDGKANLCLADFLRPKEMGIIDKLGVFSATVDSAILEEYAKDDYLSMLAQTISDRLAEATVEKMHEEVRKKIWGYAPNEHLSIEQLLREEFQGIRPAIGYPSLPDTSVNFTLNEILDMSQIGIKLTDTGMMIPHASVSGLMFAHPKARYFDLGKIGKDQLEDYAKRRGIPVVLMQRFLQSSLLKK